MTHTSTEQPEALIFANDRPSEIGDDLYQWATDAEDMILRLHSRVQELEAQTAHMADLVELADYATKKLEAAQAQRVPLSEPITHAAHRPTWDGETWAMTQIVPMNSIKVDQLKTHWVTHRDFSDDPFTAGLRYAERAHGITQEKQG